LINAAVFFCGVRGAALAMSFLTPLNALSNAGTFFLQNITYQRRHENHP
jgi:hypothetical protein